jgi:FtsP/CotA-like multicopper oxidase with cupredoxin domain
MRDINMKNAISQIARILASIVLVLSLAATAYAAVPGVTGTTFNLVAQQAYLNQPDGEAIYSWGYGCTTPPPPSAFLPQINGVPMAGAACPTMQVPGPTLIVTEGQVITINLTNNLPNAAGNTSILFPGFQLTSTCPNSAANPQGLLTCEAAPGSMVTYTFTALAPGTHAYYSGTQGDLQIEMGLYGAIIVMPSSIPANCTSGYHSLNLAAEGAWGETDFRLTNATGGKGAAYDHPAS